MRGTPVRPASNQLSISLASPLTVRVVLATGSPVVIFLFQLVEGRFAATILYAFVATSAGLARQRAIRSAMV